jgi:hypothetical protein
MNLFWSFLLNRTKSIYKIWVVAVVPPVRMGNLGDARTMVLAVRMVVIN